jgi:DegV family protein with EDD domain
MTISIVTDTTSDVPAEMVSQYDIRVVPSLIVFGQESFSDGIDLTRDAFYERLARLDTLPTTAAPGSGGFEQAYASMPPGPIVSIHTSAKLSGIYNSARIAAEPFGDRVSVVDAGSISMGVGFQVLAAAEAAVRGASLSEVLESAASARRRLKVFALLDTLENLRRGGRISLLQSSVATVLKIKPLLELVDGVPIQIATERTRSRALEDMYNRLRKLGRFDRLAVIYSDNRDLALQVRDQVAPLCTSESLVVQAAATIGTHIGPSAVAVVVVKYD